ncbi:MAG: ketoacyl-ACP synthase III [Planctomycetes bacterium]|nr:ketoacyl-ACP synthase III [Planctomycetota bacterium]
MEQTRIESNRMASSSSTPIPKHYEVLEANDSIQPLQSFGKSPSGRGRLGTCTGIRIAGTGSYIPQQVVTNEDLAELGCDSDWIVQRTGIRERRRATKNQATSDLAFEAANDCLRDAGVSAADVDLLICATITPDYMTPSTACILQNRLGCVAPAFDVNAACAGFMVGLVTAAQYVRSGMATNALVVGSEIMSRTVDTSDVKTYPLFGDGAGAALLQPCAPTNSNGLIRFTLGAEGDVHALCIPGGGSREPLTAQTLATGRQFLQMDGRTVFKWAVRVVEDSVNDVLQTAGLQAKDIDLVILHQANIRILDAAISHFAIPRERMFVNLDRFGNTSAASIPLALDQANREGRLNRGDLVLLSGFGAGLSWGTCLLRW